jgi:hypothetical protein
MENLCKPFEIDEELTSRKDQIFQPFENKINYCLVTNITDNYLLDTFLCGKVSKLAYVNMVPCINDEIAKYVIVGTYMENHLTHSRQLFKLKI